MTTKRTPIHRPPIAKITPRAIELFDRLRRTRDRDRWWDVHNQLHEELRCKPWEWPCVENPDAPVHPTCKPKDDARERWLVLAEASREARRVARRATKAEAERAKGAAA